jgi:glycosyltransferase
MIPQPLVTIVSESYPKISVVTTVRNAADTIADCIESVSHQSFPAEHIIVDGGSSDGTVEITSRYASSRLKLFLKDRLGVYAGMNYGIQAASGEIIGILNGDDMYAGPHVLSKIVRVFGKSHVQSCYGDLVYVAPLRTNQVIRYWKSGSFNYRRFYWGWMPPHPTFFLRKTVYKEYGLYRSDLGSAADYELMLRFLVKHKITATYIPEILVKMRTGGISNISSKNRIGANMCDRVAWKINGLKPYPWTLYFKPLSKILQYFIKPCDSIIH